MIQREYFGPDKFAKAQLNLVISTPVSSSDDFGSWELELGPLPFVSRSTRRSTKITVPSAERETRYNVLRVELPNRTCAG